MWEHFSSSFSSSKLGTSVEVPGGGCVLGVTFASRNCHGPIPWKGMSLASDDLITGIDGGIVVVRE